MFGRLQGSAIIMLSYLDDISLEEQSDIFDPDTYKATNFDTQTANSQKYAWVLEIATAYEHRLDRAKATMRYWADAWTREELAEGKSFESLDKFRKRWESNLDSLMRQFRDRSISSKGQQNRV
jgi:hypothetical protein